MRQIAVSILMLGGLGCGAAAGTDVHSRNGPTQFSGTSAALARTKGSVSGQPVSFLFVGIFELPPRCDSTGDGTMPETYETMTLGIVRPGTDPIGPGTWLTSRNTPELLDGAFAQYQKWLDGQLISLSEAVSGSIKLTKADDVVAEGELDAILEDGTELAGRFFASAQCVD